jgi:DNA-binding NarL/FixJ family response regulator
MALRDRASEPGPVVAYTIVLGQAPSTPAIASVVRRLLGELSLEERRALVAALVGVSLPGRSRAMDSVPTASAAQAMEPSEPIPTTVVPAETLSRREREIAHFIGRVLSNREIAEVLVLSIRTVEAHVTHVLTKLGLRSRAQIAVWAAHHVERLSRPANATDAASAEPGTGAARWRRP